MQLLSVCNPCRVHVQEVTAFVVIENEYGQRLTCEAAAATAAETATTTAAKASCMCSSLYY